MSLEFLATPFVPARRRRHPRSPPAASTALVRARRQTGPVRFAIIAAVTYRARRSTPRVSKAARHSPHSRLLSSPKRQGANPPFLPPLFLSPTKGRYGGVGCYGRDTQRWWVMLDHYAPMRRRNARTSTPSPPPATCRNSGGDVVRVSYSPSATRRRRRCRACATASPRSTTRPQRKWKSNNQTPYASLRHPRPLLATIGMSYDREESYRSENHLDYFVYSAGAASTSADDDDDDRQRLKPSWRRSQGHRHNKRAHQLDDASTGLLRRGESDLVVAELTVKESSDNGNCDAPIEAELLVFRSGRWGWGVVASSEISQEADDELYG
uniref:Uncharacterized protein n=1 Tax=Oryza barthii TaxID=65489 RepID=A0A0D3HIL9_9ORYZ